MYAFNTYLTIVYEMTYTVRDSRTLLKSCVLYMNKMGRVTIKDVAKEAGVSCAITSFVLNNVEGRFSEESRQKVMKAVKKLGYVPDLNAKQLRTNVSNCIMLVYSQTFLEEQNASTLQFILDVIRVTKKRGQDVIIRTIHSHRDWQPVKQEYIKLWRSKRADGIIFDCAVDDQVPNEFFSDLYQNYGVNLVEVAHTNMVRDYPTVYADSYLWTQKALDHIVSKGYSEIYFIAMDYVSFYPDRVRAYLDYIKQHDICGDLLQYKTIYRDKNEIWSLMEPILKRQQKDLAFLCWNDVDAISVAELLNMKNISKKFRVGIMGFDDLPTAAHTNSPITTVHYPYQEIAESCVRLLEQQREDRSTTAPSICLNSRIIERESL